MSKPTSTLKARALLALPFAGIALAVCLSIVAPGLARAEDIGVNASVIDSTPSAQPSQYVTLPIGQQTSTTPSVEIQLTGLDPYSFVQVFAQSDPILIASGFADKYGVFKTKAPIPAGLEAGAHSITASVQKEGATTAVLQTLARFEVSAGGKVAAAPKGSGSTGSGSGAGSGGIGSTNGSSGGSANGGEINQSPVATPMPTHGSSSIGGVLLVGGISAKSTPSWSLLGDRAQVSVSLQNNYKAAYAVSGSVVVRNILGFEVARISKFRIEKLESLKHLLVTAQTNSPIGQWGFYTAEIRIVPPSSIDGIALNGLTREANFFVIPIWPSVALMLLAIWGLLNRFALQNLRQRRIERMLAAAHEEDAYDAEEDRE